MGSMQGRCRVDVGSMWGRCGVDVGSMWGSMFYFGLFGLFERKQ